MTLRNIVRDQWLIFIKELLALTWYQRFEHIVALALTILVSLIMLMAMYRLSVGILTT